MVPTSNFHPEPLIYGSGLVVVHKFESENHLCYVRLTGNGTCTKFTFEQFMVS